MNEMHRKCFDLGIELGELMTLITEDRGASAVGINMDKVDGKIVANITKKASETYFHPRTGNSLGSILDLIVDECKGMLPLSITKMGEGDYIVIQQIHKKD